ncbi:hypothetical protein Pmar_PMAR024694 [Perkinsus marinus ATCC 50983]|uniref:Uncharacterized protein n=1 Tax=Perkinsus marinus (strain ATCC 50983 / TXsc) TaxID=423536 RepID=C5M123_PERM5|nr:hypothetical protein Pmar_PMAR024694 [Perkinsus marinus ATCC 50983]EEQ97253.1 hypothetical protein Pmar_PMAR024694 [Perkinsus marinus ATCC 50983]|eukprot:XP_002764536.1 hypothetical protein Pmar_PMAR024694 [Perkinsus marinus ATCC 50983]
MLAPTVTSVSEASVPLVRRNALIAICFDTPGKTSMTSGCQSSRAPTRAPRSRTVAVEASRATPTRPPPRKAPPTCIVAHNKPDRLVTYRRGQLVQAFISQIPENDYDPDMGWMMVGSRVEAQVSPRLGMTDGWVDATIVDDFDKSQYHAELRETWPVVEYTHTLWGDGRGAMLDGNKAYNLRQSMRMEHIRLATSERRTPSLSLLIVRYGDGSRRVDTRFDMAVTDELITDLMREGIYATSVGAIYSDEVGV